MGREHQVLSINLHNGDNRSHNKKPGVWPGFDGKNDSVGKILNLYLAIRKRGDNLQLSSHGTNEAHNLPFFPGKCL